MNNDTMTLFLATSILAAGGLGLYVFNSNNKTDKYDKKNKDDDDEEEDFFAPVEEDDKEEEEEEEKKKNMCQKPN